MSDLSCPVYSEMRLKRGHSVFQGPPAYLSACPLDWANLVPIKAHPLFLGLLLHCTHCLLPLSPWKLPQGRRNCLVWGLLSSRTFFPTWLFGLLQWTHEAQLCLDLPHLIKATKLRGGVCLPRSLQEGLRTAFSARVHSRSNREAFWERKVFLIHCCSLRPPECLLGAHNCLFPEWMNK